MWQALKVLLREIRAREAEQRSTERVLQLPQGFLRLTEILCGVSLPAAWVVNNE